MKGFSRFRAAAARSPTAPATTATSRAPETITARQFDPGSVFIATCDASPSSARPDETVQWTALIQNDNDEAAEARAAWALATDPCGPRPIMAQSGIVTVAPNDDFFVAEFEQPRDALDQGGCLEANTQYPINAQAVDVQEGTISLLDVRRAGSNEPFQRTVYGAPKGCSGCGGASVSMGRRVKRAFARMG